MKKLINIRFFNLLNFSIHHLHFSTNKNTINPPYLCQETNNYQSKSKSKEINPYWITGFIDAEGCFSVIIEISDKTKWKIKTSFEINLHIKDVEILYKIKSFFFCVGAVYLKTNKNIAVFRFTNSDILRNIIIPH